MRRGKRLTVIVGIVAGLLAMSAVAIAASNAFQSKGINNVRVKTETSPYVTSSTAWVSLPGGSLAMSVPNGKQKLFIAEFDAESYCQGGSGWCSVRILVNGVEMHPASGGDFAFDTVDTDGYEAHAMTRTYGPLGPGQHTFQVQVKTNNAATDFRLDDWTFKVFKGAA
jgi:hypothetical protein